MSKVTRLADHTFTRFIRARERGNPVEILKHYRSFKNHAEQYDGLDSTLNRALVFGENVVFPIVASLSESE